MGLGKTKIAIDSVAIPPSKAGFSRRKINSKQKLIGWKFQVAIPPNKAGISS